MKVLFINNYPMDQAWEAWRNGKYPGHHLWGVTDLSKYGIDVDILPHEKYVVLNKIGRRLKLRDYLDQQVRIFIKILLNWHQYDLIYSACETNTVFLALMRRLGVFRKPIVAIMHCPLRSSLKHKIFIKGHDKLLCLTSKIKRRLEEEFYEEEKLELLEWAVDLSFYEYQTKSHPVKSDSFIVSAGKTNRDYNTLVKAFSEIDYPLRIYCSEASAPSIPHLTPNVQVRYEKSTETPLPFKELLAEYRAAYAVAIPLELPQEYADFIPLIGLTSLLEAMAMGKAVITTRNTELGIDVEKEGVGIWVEPGDVKGWRQAVSYLLAHPQETMEMGERGRNLCKSRYDLENFSSRLAKILKSVILQPRMKI